MKIVATIVLVCNLSVLANTGYSQKSISIQMQNVQLSEIIAEIARQSEMRFLYNSTLVNRIQGKYSLEVHNKTLSEVMDEALKSTELIYEVIDNVVVIKRKAAIEDSQVKSSPHYELFRRISGNVTMENGDPLPGATVMEKGTTNGTITDIDGNYGIEINDPQAILVFSFIGYESKEINVGEENVINVSLSEDVRGLEEVVVVGYGTTTRKDLTGSVSSVAPKVLESNTFADVGLALQGQISGVNILAGNGSPGEPVQVSIRGVSSLLGDVSPLIVLDEVPMPSEFNLNDLNPQDIESIDVLKGASSAAIYGSRAASGVVIIRTKRGKLGAAPQVNYSYTYGRDQLTTEIEVLSAEEWKYMMFEGVKNAAAYNGYSDVTGFIHYDKFTTPGFYGEYNTNWLKEMLQNSDFHNHSLSIRGGSAASNYTASIGYLNDQGMMRESGFNRYNVNLGLTTEVSDKLTFGIDFRGNVSDREVATETLSGATKGRPDIRAYNDDGTLFLNTYLQNGNGQKLLIESPLATLLDNKDITSAQTASISGFLQYEIVKGLNFKTRFNYYNYSSSQKQFYANTTMAGAGFGFVKSGTLYDTDNTSRQTEWENSLSYSRKMGDHYFDAILATSYLTEDRTNSRIWFDDFPDNVVQTEIHQGATFRSVTGYHNQAFMMSYISRLNYKFKDRYLLTASYRRDGSSRFSADNAFGDFPALAVAWLASEEKFLSSANWIDLLKIRASAGQTGMANVGYYQWRTTYEATDYNGESAVIPDQTGNENLQWEATLQKDFGLDFRLFNSRLKGSIVYYVKNTDGLLYPFTMAPSTGYSRATVNFAEIKNSGLDIDLHFDVIRKKDIFWSVGFNFNNNKNIVQKLDKDYITSTDGSQNLSNSIIKEGYPLGLIYGFKTKGIYSSQEQIEADQALNEEFNYQRDMMLGEVRFADLNGDGYVDMSTASAIGNEDRTILGNSLPEFSGGVSSTFNFRNWTLNIFGSYSYGNDKVWVNELYNFGADQGQPKNVWRTSLQRWTPENPDSRYPSFRLSRSFPSREFNDFSVYDASFFKIQNIHLEYEFPTPILDKLKVVSSLRLFTNVTNVHTFTKYPGPNPESYASGNRIQGASLDYSEYPQNRTYNLGFKVNFK